MHLRLIYLLLALWSCQNAQRIPKNGVFISCVPEKDIVEQVVYHQDTLSLHYRAVELENNEFDTIFLDICKKFTFDAHPFLRYDVQYFFDENKRRVAKNLIYTSCKSKLDTISIAKNEKKVLFIDMPDFDLKVDSTVAIWGFKFHYYTCEYDVMVDSAGQRLQKRIVISSGEKNFQNKPAFEDLPGYTY